MGIVAALTFVFLTFPLALIETPKSPRFNVASVKIIFKQCFPLFLAVFLFNLIESMPKFVMEGVLPYESQLYFNALYFPAQGIMLAIQLVYKPLLVRLTKEWADPSRRKRFDIAILSMIGIIIAFTAAMGFVMAWIGIPLMSWIYGLDFEQFRGLAYIMVVAGGVTAAIDFLYQVITVLRRQSAVTKLYIITFGFSVFVPLLLINFTGLPGAIIGYLIVMAILLSLLAMEYISIRMEFNHGKPWEDDSANDGNATLPINPSMSGRIDISQADALRVQKRSQSNPGAKSERRAAAKATIPIGKHSKKSGVEHGTSASARHAAPKNPQAKPREESQEQILRERARKARLRKQLMEEAEKEKQRAYELERYRQDTQALGGRRQIRKSDDSSARGKHRKR